MRLELFVILLVSFFTNHFVEFCINFLLRICIHNCYRNTKYTIINCIEIRYAHIKLLFQNYKRRKKKRKDRDPLCTIFSANEYFARLNLQFDPIHNWRTTNTWSVLVTLKKTKKRTLFSRRSTVECFRVYNASNSRYQL